MSFDISGPGPSRKPVIREAQSMENNGGGGNLGYMQNGKRKKKDQDEFEGEILFLEDGNEDSFKKEQEKHSSSETNDDCKDNKKSSFVDKIKNFLNNDNKNLD